MTEKQKSFVYKYWSKTELGRAMIASDSVSDSDLLFLIPNNVKRRNGLPVTKIYGKRKSAIKRKRKRQILLFKSFDLINKIVEETIAEKFNSNNFITDFVDVKNVDIGDKCYFKPSLRFDTTIPMYSPIININNIL
jgi:hypothetical protein